MELKISPGEAGDNKLYYSSLDGAYLQRGCIGHLRADFDNAGKFWHTWWDHAEELKDEHFKSELDAVVNELRDGPLKSMDAFSSYLYSGQAGEINENYYGLKIETDDHAYYLRGTPRQGDYNVYLYCYKKDLLDKYMGQAGPDTGQAEPGVMEQSM